MLANFYTKMILLSMLTACLALQVSAASRTWTGSGAGGAGTDFNDPSNWTGSGALTSSDDLTVTLTSAATLQVTADVTIGSLAFTVNVGSGTTYGRIDANGNTLTIDGTATFVGQTYAGSNWDIAELDCGSSSGGFIFKGTTSFQASGNGDTHFEADVSNPGSMEFQGNVTFGGWCYTTPGDEPNFIFNAPGAQTITCNQATSYTMGENITFGTTNTPTVTFSGSNPWRFNCYQDDVTIADNTTVDLGTGSMDRYLSSAGSNFTMGAGSTLKIYGTRTFPGDNLTGFNDFGTYTLDPTSTVNYYGTTQTIKGSNVTYGNLQLNSSTKTSGGDFDVKGNWVNNATFSNGSDTHTFSGTTDQQISGSNAPNFYNLVVNKSSGTLTSSVNFNATNELQIDAGTLLLDGESVEARTAFDMNGGTLRVTGGSFIVDENSDTAWDQDGGTIDVQGGTVSAGDVSSDDLADINFDGGTMTISGGTVNASDEFDMDGGSLTVSGTGVLNVAAYTGAGAGTADSKFSVGAGTFNMSGGSIYVMGAYDNTSSYPGINLNPTTANMTGGTIYASETGSNDESFYIRSNGNPIANLTVDKSGAGGTSTVEIWNEDFEDRSQGDESDAGATAWSTACTGGGTCGIGDGSANDYFEVRNSTTLSGSRCYTGRDMDGEAKWTSASINISGYSNVSVSIDLGETGGDDGSDYVNAYYSIDGGAETLMTNGGQSGSFGTATATATGLSGTTIQVFVYMNNNGGNDLGHFDDIVVSGDIATVTNTLYLADALDVDGDLTITSGTLDPTVSNYSINIAGDWDNRDTFTAQNGTVTFDGNGAQVIANASGETFYNLVASKGTGDITLDNNVIVSNTLTLTKGVFSTGGNILYTSRAAGNAITGHNSTSFVNGNLRRAVTTDTDTYPFPVGNGSSTTNYYLAEMDNNSLTGTSYIQADFGAVPGGGTMSLSEAGTDYLSIATEGVWTLNPDIEPTGGSYDMRLYVTNFAGLADNRFTPLKRPAGSTDAADWDCTPCGFGNPGVPSNGSTGRLVTDGYGVRQGYTSFSQHGIGISDAPLPIELIAFDAQPTEDGEVLLTWTTATEINNDYFTIERTLDGENFEVVGIVMGAGNSSSEIDYELIDARPHIGESYYRLVQTDFDGTTTRSDLRLVKMDAGTFVLNVYPNPSNGENVFIELDGDQTSFSGSVLIRDMTGRVVYQDGLQTISGSNRMQLTPSEKLAAGMYAVLAEINGTLYQQLFLVK